MYLASKRNIAIILAMVFAVPTSLIATTPAYADAYDGDNASTIVVSQAPTKVEPSVGDSGKPPAGPCSRDLPNSPVIICGYASFSNVKPPSYSGAKNANRGLRPREATGLPPETFNSGQSNILGGVGLSGKAYSWDDIGVNYTYSRNEARDLAYGGQNPVSFQKLDRANVGVASLYFSKGIYWRDTRYWQERMAPPTTQKIKVVVGKNQWIDPVVEPRRWVPAKRDRFGKVIVNGYWIPERTIQQGYWKKPTPKTVPVEYVVEDLTKRRQTGPTGKTKTCTYDVCTFTVTFLKFYPQWLARTVVFSGMAYHKTPETVEVWCQTELGPGKLVGPYDHARKPLNSQIGYRKTDLDPQTTLRQWWTKPPDSLASRTKKAPGGGFILMSEIGELQEKTKGIFVRGNQQALNQVTTCIQKKPTYKADAAKQPCVVLEPSSPFFGRELPASHELCQAFVPGNYTKDLSESKEMKCIYTKRSWIGLPQISAGVRQDLSPFLLGPSEGVLVGLPTSSQEGFKPITFIHCDKPIPAKGNPERSNSPNAIDYPITKAFWACEGDRPAKGNNMWHPDRNYDFLTCGYTFACIVPGGDDRPTITDVNSNTSSISSSQVLSSGAQTKVSWKTPSAIAVYDSRGRLLDTVAPDRDKAWQQWRVLDGSTPWYSTKDPNDQSQPAFGSNIINANPSSGQSILNGAKNGWENPDIYIRGYKGTDIANTTRRIGDIVVRQGELIPFAIDTEYRATIPKEMVVFDRPISINQPVVCTMPPSYLYFVSGRATG